jgi:hypothetical protein
MRVVGAALMLGCASACTDPCDLVLGCTESRRVAVEGRLFAVIDGKATPGATVRVLAEYAARVDSTESTSDSRGLFSLSIAAPGSEVPRIALRVIPPNRPGYLVVLGDCKPVLQWGDACVIAPLLNEPTLPLLRILDTDSNPVTHAQMFFKRTGGAALMTRSGGGVTALDSVASVTGDDGIANPFPLEIWAGSNDAVIGDLVVDLPPPIGRVVRRDYAVTPSVFYDLRIVVTERVGPAAGLSSRATRGICTSQREVSSRSLPRRPDPSRCSG